MKKSFLIIILFIYFILMVPNIFGTEKGSAADSTLSEFSFDRMKDYFSERVPRIARMKNGELVYVVGNMGAGKSSFINYLY